MLHTLPVAITDSQKQSCERSIDPEHPTQRQLKRDEELAERRRTEGDDKETIRVRKGDDKETIRRRKGDGKDTNIKDQQPTTNTKDHCVSAQQAAAQSQDKPKESKKKEKKVYDERINELNAQINVVSKLRKHDWRDVILYFENTHKLPGEKLVAFMGSDGFHGTWGDPETSWREICSTPSRLKRKGDHIAAKASRPPTQLSKRDYSRHDPTINLRDKSRWMP